MQELVVKAALVSEGGFARYLHAIKKFPLLEWSVFDNGNINQHSNKTTNVFTLADHSCSTIYKIRTLTETEAKDWIRLIKQATNNLRQFYI